MTSRTKLPLREQVFILSLMYHGFRKTYKRHNLKYRHGFVIPATKHEDASGIDFWIKMPRDERLFPVQITQRGVRLFRSFRRPSNATLEAFIKQSERRIEEKRQRCRRHGIAFVLVRDYGGRCTYPSLARDDIQALRNSIAHLRRWL